MKTQITKKLFGFILITVLSVSVIVIVNGCQEEAVQPNNDSMTARKPQQSLIAGIVYTDVNPDVTKMATRSTGASYYLDLNKDNINDFLLTVGFNALQRCGAECRPGTYSLTVTALDNNLVLDSSNLLAKPLILNDIIQASSTIWSPGKSYILNRTGNPCCGGSGWISIGTTEKYLGLKVNKGSNSYYGWARLSVTSSLFTSFTVKDYAYNSASNQSIRAGQTN